MKYAYVRYILCKRTTEISVYGYSRDEVLELTHDELKRKVEAKLEKGMNFSPDSEEYFTTLEEVTGAWYMACHEDYSKYYESNNLVDVYECWTEREFLDEDGDMVDCEMLDYHLSIMEYKIRLTAYNFHDNIGYHFKGGHEHDKVQVHRTR